MSGGLPGYETIRTASVRDVLFALAIEELHPGGVIIDSATAIDGRNSVTNEIRPGWLLARSTNTGKYVPCKLTRTKAFASSGASNQGSDYTDVKVDNAAAFRVGDVISVGNDNSLTITSINYWQNLIRVNDPILFTADQLVKGPYETHLPVGILMDFVKLRNDANDTDKDKSASMLMRGTVNLAYILGDWATALIARDPSLNAASGGNQLPIPDRMNGIIFKHPTTGKIY